MQGGYVGKILKVDLSSGKISDQKLPGEDVLKKYIGGYGLGLRMLYDMLPPGTRATDPENPLIFLTGPLTGLHLPGATNITLTTKNFDTGFTVGRSHTHAMFGILMKHAGYDGVIVTGASKKPVYLWIHDGQAEIRDASKLWGKDTHDSEDLVKAELNDPKASVAAIGPAGENLCAGAMICNDKYHSFSHSGTGTAMGAKKLKAIAVSGARAIPVANAARITDLSKDWLEHMSRPGQWLPKIEKQATKKNDYVLLKQGIGLCGKNFQVNQMDEFGPGFGKQKYTSRPCPRCPIGCSYDVEITTGPHKGYVATLSGGSEAIEGAGTVLGIVEPGEVFHLTDVYDRLGVEGSTAGCTLAMAIEAYERGLISGKDTDGLELKWGDAELAEKLIRKYVARDGFGDVLARGMKEAAEQIGGDAPSFAVHNKGAAVNLHDWRAAWGILFGQIVSSGAGWPAAGADCFVAEPDAGFPQKTNPMDPKTKPAEAKNTGILKFMHDSTGLCWFITWGLPDVLKLTADSISAATGWDYTPAELLAAGERIMHLERAFNVRQGLKPEDDYIMPARLIDAPNDGPAKGISIRPYLKGMVEEYYRLMGWDPRSGKPWRNVLAKCDLDDVAKDLWGA